MEQPVSTLIRPSGRMQRGRGARRDQAVGVSTLIRPSGRMQPEATVPDQPPGVPVSTLIRPSGRMQLAAFPPAQAWGRPCHQEYLFQPSSDLQAGCNHDLRVGHRAVAGVVSTLIRPSGRMQRCSIVAGYWLRHQFQPSSDLQAGCNLYAGKDLVLSGEGFQPSSDLQAGCNRSSTATMTAGGLCFNPHPTFRPDATHIQRDVRPLLRVSTLIRPSGRMQPGTTAPKTTATCFNPHPTFRPDATSKEAGWLRRIS